MILVNFFMISQLTRSFESFSTCRAIEWILSGMTDHVPLSIYFFEENYEINFCDIAIFKSVEFLPV